MAHVGPYRGREFSVNWRGSMAFKDREGTVSEIPERAWVHVFLCLQGPQSPQLIENLIIPAEDDFLH